MQNFEIIAFLWGKLVCLETSIKDTLSFESMKILIDTDRFHGIEGQVVLHIGDAGFMIMIKEASCTFQINPQFVIPTRSASTEVKDLTEAMKKSKVQGDGVNSADELVSNHWPNVERMDGANSEGVEREALRFDLEGKDVLHSASINSNSKTKAVQFSQNGYSKEVIKIS